MRLQLEYFLVCGESELVIFVVPVAEEEGTVGGQRIRVALCTFEHIHFLIATCYLIEVPVGGLEFGSCVRESASMKS